MRPMYSRAKCAPNEKEFTYAVSTKKRDGRSTGNVYKNSRRNSYILNGQKASHSEEIVFTKIDA